MFKGPVNCLEQEAYDLVHARIQVIEAKAAEVAKANAQLTGTSRRH